MLQRRIVHFVGRVQGVGFRWTATRIAAGFTLVGRVRNLPDGRVRCEVEGDTAEITAFLAELHKAMGGHIRETQEQVAPVLGTESDFRVG